MIMGARRHIPYKHEYKAIGLNGLTTQYKNLSVN